jgi:hypothetical protein
MLHTNGNEPIVVPDINGNWPCKKVLAACCGVKKTGRGNCAMAEEGCKVVDPTEDVAPCDVWVVAVREKLTLMVTG